MNSLVELQDGEVTTTSLQVAEQFGKQHKDVLRAIDNLRGGLRNIAPALEIRDWFVETTYINEKNHQEFRMYNITKNGFVLLAGGFTDKKFMEFKVKYIEQFDAMKNYIKEQEQHSFFIPETVDQQLTREKLAISKRRSMNDRSREVRAWVKLSENSEEIVKTAASIVLSQLLDIPEVELLGSGQEV